MSAVTLPAHFDGTQIVLDEPYNIPLSARLFVTLLPDGGAQERAEWASFATQGLSRAYGEDEPEYALDAVKEPNPTYEGR